MNDVMKNLCLLEELETGRDLILSGFRELQEIGMGRDFYYLPQQLLAGGLEHLFKGYFCLVFEARHGRYPDKRFLKDLGHDLEKLMDIFARDYFNTNDIPLLRSDLEFLQTDSLLQQIIRILSEFGQQARYYNLDIVTGSNKPAIDPKAEWGELEKQIEDPARYLTDGSLEALHRDYFPRVNSRIIAKLERVVRAVGLQFTLGRHGGRLQQFSSVLMKFDSLRDGDFGTRDYRRLTSASRDNWVKRARERRSWPSMVVRREEFRGEWPFRADQAVVECRDKLFCVINIEGYDFALNGAARTRYGLPDPHDAGIAIIGRSVGPFIDMAFGLSEREANGSRT